MANASDPSTALKRTPLYDLHVSLGAKMVPFAGYEMPVQYPMGVLKEHLWTRENAGLFDVSHMGQAYLVAEDGKHETVARALEALVPADILNLGHGRQRYSQLLADDGGILDDLMVSRPAIEADYPGQLDLVVNAGGQEADYAHIAARLPKGVTLRRLERYDLLAIQGPKAAATLDTIIRGVAQLMFMTNRHFMFAGDTVRVSRSGYTGEDGYEISVPESVSSMFLDELLANADVKPIGLGARDSLRLEAGLCLYGHDIDTTTSPIEADLAWSIQKRRRVEGGFPGSARIQRELAEGPSRKRVGIKPDGKAPAREGTEIQSIDGAKIGTITSGGFGPTVNGPIAMGYVATAHAQPGTKVNLIVRGKPLPAVVVKLPFTEHRYVR